VANCTTPSPSIRRQIRGIFDASNHVPVKVLPGGALAPRLLGKRGGHFTRGGSRISHPSAYGRKGWSNMVYHCSTQRIVVGERWLAENV
jgi:hypothetical protein